MADLGAVVESYTIAAPAPKKGIVKWQIKGACPNF